MIERSLLPSVPVGSGRHVMRLGHGGERAVGRATGGAVPAVTMSMTMEVVAAAAVVVAAAGVEEDRGGQRGTTVLRIPRIETALGTHFSMFSLAIFVSKPVRSQENLENESSYQGFSLGLFFFFFFS